MKYSAGIIPFRINKETNELEFFVGHPGGYWWKNKNYWAFLKGNVENGENWQETALREFKEESGLSMEDYESQIIERSKSDFGVAYEELEDEDSGIFDSPVTD